MAYSQEQINAALAAELAARPNTSAYDLAAYAMQTYGITPAQIDTAYQSLNVSALPETIDYETNYGGAPVGSFRAEGTTGYTGPSHKVTDPATGKQVELIFNAPGFNPTDPTTLRYLGEQNWRDPNSYGGTWYNNFATPAQKATADALWSADWKKLNAQDIANEVPGAIASGMMPKTGAEAQKIATDLQNAAAEKARLASGATTGLLSGKTLQAEPPATTQTALVTQPGPTGQTDAGTTRQAMGQAMETVGVKKTYTDAEMKQALRDLSWLEPNASVKDIISAAGTYGISKDKVIEHLSSFTYTTKNVDKLAQQILAQNTTATWKGDVKPATAARYMADELAKSGITDISQVGKGADGIINKETGQKLISGYGERTKGNLWSGTYEGGGNTGFGVQFTEAGKPIFYTEGASSSTLKKDLVKAAIIAGAALGIAGPESLAGIFGSGTAATAGLTAAEAAGLGLTAAETAALGFTAAELTAAGYTAAEIAGATAATTAATTTTTGLLTGNTAATAATALTTSELATAAKLGLTAAQYAGLISAGGQTAAGLLQQQTSKEAAEKAQKMIDTETAAAKTAAQFRPVGMTTRFGTSEFKVDPVTGQLISAGYTASPGVLEAQNRLVALGNQGLAQAEAAQGQFAPLQAGAERLFELGQGYLAKTPEQVAQNYLNQQMALLQPGRELELANLQNKLQQQGRGGLAVAQGGALGDTTPELQALFNARAQQEAQLAANAQQYGQQNVAFGAGLLGAGAQTMGQYYAGQQAAYAPYTTALGQFTNLEQLAQQPLTMGASLAQQSAQAGANVGRLGLLGAGQSVALATGADATRNLTSSALGGLTSNPLFTDALTKIAGGTPVNALDFSAYGKGDIGFQNMLNDIYG